MAHRKHRDRMGTLVGTYGSRIGAATALHPFVQDRIPPQIASNAAGTVLRLYVPKSRRGQITDIGIVNAVYKAPGAPFVPRNGGPIYTAPVDPPKYRDVAPARMQSQPQGYGYRDAMDSWQPGPGDRFKVVEVA